MLLAENNESSFILFINDILHNQVFMATISGWIMAVITKAFVSLISHRKLLLENFLGPGGMPSTHTSPIAAMMLMVGLVEGFDTTIFAVGAVLLSVVMYDASGIRRAAGRHAKAINIIFRGLQEREQIRSAQLIELKELLGHEPIEVAGGAVIGMLTAYYVWLGGYFAA